MYMFLKVSTVTRTNIDSFNLTIKNHQSKISFHIKFCEIDKQNRNNQLQHLHNELKHFTSELKYTFSTIILVNELINKKRNPHWRCFLCFLYDFTDAAYFEYLHHLSLIKKLNLQVVIFSSENKWKWRMMKQRCGFTIIVVYWLLKNNLSTRVVFRNIT